VLNNNATEIKEELKKIYELRSPNTAYGIIGRNADLINSLVFGSAERVSLPVNAAFAGSATKSYEKTRIGDYINDLKGNRISANETVNKQLQPVIDELEELLELQKPLNIQEVRQAEKAISLEALEAETKLNIRTDADLARRDLVLNYYKARERLKAKLNFLSAFASQTLPTEVTIDTLLQPFETTSSQDRETRKQLSELYGASLVDELRVRTVQKLTEFKPGTRREIIEEVQRLLGTGFVSNGSLDKLQQIRDLAAEAQRRYFKTELRRLVAGRTDLSPESIEKLITQVDTFSVDDLDFKQELRVEGYEQLRIQNRSRILLFFRVNNALDVVGTIRTLPQEFPEDIELQDELLEKLKEYTRRRKDVSPTSYDSFFKQEIELIRAEGAKPYEIRDVGYNYGGAKLSRDNYQARLQPLLQVLEGDKETVGKIAAALSPESRRQFVLDFMELKKQRKLTPIEEAWFKSAVLTSFSIPYLVALVRADREVALQHLEYLFAKISRETQEKLNQIQYFPSVVVGLGPNGMAGLGEVRRLIPELLDGTLIVDQARNPGGPFAVPESAAFNLNSQAPRLTATPQLPDRPNYDESQSIQGFVSPLQALPGQRTEGDKVARSLSINQTDAGLLADKDIAGDIYPTNEDLELVVKLQSAMTIKNLALRTRFVSVERNNTRLPGNKLVTLEITQADGTKRMTQVTTDILIVATGLGEADYGFNPKGKRAEGVIQASEEQAQTDSIPKVTTTLDAFRGLGGRFEEKVGSGLGRVVGIGGKGNSFDTLAEKIVGKFVPSQAREQAKKIRDTIGKIYVIAPNPPRNAKEYLEGQRSRYANLADFIDRGDGADSNERLISFVDARIGDFGFADNDTTKPTRERKINLYDDKDQKVKNKRGQVINFDNYFATTGFKSIQEEIFDTYASQNGRVKFEKKPFTLSSAPKIQVGETLDYDEDVLFIGTGAVFASNPRLQEDKLRDIAKVSPEAADALLRVGAKNLVAVGVKSRESVATVNDYIWQRRDKIKGLMQKFRDQDIDRNRALAKVRMTPKEEAKAARLSNQLSTEQKELFAAGVIATELAGEELKDLEGNPLNRDYIFEVSPFPQGRDSSLFNIDTLFVGDKPVTLNTPLFRTDLINVYANEVNDPSRVSKGRRKEIGEETRAAETRITRATKVFQGERLPFEPVPIEVTKALEVPHFIKTMSNILPNSDTGRFRVRVSIRGGRVLPQRTQVKMVHEF